MEQIAKVKVWRRGQMTIPARLRKKLGIENNTILSVYEMGRGILLVPGELIVDRLGREVQQLADREGVTLEDMLAALAEDRRGRAEPPPTASDRPASPGDRAEQKAERD